MLTAAILGGGRATRFGGRDKSALVVEGRTIFDRQMAELTQIADEILFVAPATLRVQPAPYPGVTSVADLMPGCGPLGGLHAALMAARSEVVIVVACDMPYLSAPLLAHLASFAGTHVEAGASDEVVAVVPQTERGYHPLCAVYTRAAIEPVERRLAVGRLTMTDLLTDLRLRIVTSEEIARFGDPHRLLANVNTPADHRSLEALHNHEV